MNPIAALACPGSARTFKLLDGESAIRASNRRGSDHAAHAVRRRHIHGLAWILWTYSLAASGAEQAVQEVFQSELVFPQERNEWQFTARPSFADGDDFHRQELGLGVEYGLTDRLQLEVGWDAMVRHHEQGESAHAGTGDVELGAQYSFMNLGGTATHVALGAEWGIPSGYEDKELGEGRTSHGFNLVLARDCHCLGGLHLYANVGFEKNDEEREDHLHFGAILPGDGRSYTFELNRFEEDRYVTPGLVWAPARGVEFGTGVGVGLNDAADAWRLMFNIAFEP